MEKNSSITVTFKGVAGVHNKGYGLFLDEGADEMIVFVTIAWSVTNKHNMWL